MPLSQGNGPGLSPRVIGEIATTTDPKGSVPSNDSRGTPVTIYAAGSDGTQMNPGMINLAGGSQPHNNVQPFLGVNYCIALSGIYPSRS